MRKYFGPFIWLLAIAAIGGGAFLFYQRATAAPERSYRTAPVKRGSLVASISATGTVEPEEVVDIGAQVAGRINSFGTDKAGTPIDYGSIIEANTVLAQIDTSLYQSDLDQAKAQVDIDTAGVAKARADLETSKAKLEQAKADEGTLKAKLDQANSDLTQFNAKLEQVQSDLQQFNAKVDQTKSDLQQFQAKYEQAQRDWARAQKLGPSDALSQEAYDAFKGVYEAALASVNSAKSMIAQADANAVSQKAVIAQAKANIESQKSVIAQSKAAIESQKSVIAQASAAILSSDAAIKQAQGTVAHDVAGVSRAQQNVDYCTIKSPVKGVIIDRRVNIGQTVVSSLNAPSLFLLAKDLNRMQVWVSMNEADIGNIKPGQPVTFTIDAFAGRVFKGSVRKVRLNATMTQNVVTYTVEVETDNSSGTLLPYMTANAQFEVAHRDDVLLVPNAALRYVPKPDEIAPDVVQEDDEKPSHGHGHSGSENPSTVKAETTAKSDTPEKPAHVKSGMGRARVWIKDGNFVRPIRVRTGITDGTNTEVKSDELAEETALVVGKQMHSSDGDSTKNPFAVQMGRPRSSQSSQSAQPK